MMTWTDTFIAKLHHSTTVLEIGTFVATDRSAHPAVLTRNLYGQLWVWTPTGRKGAPENHVRDDRFKPGWVMVNGRAVKIVDAVSNIGIF